MERDWLKDGVCNEPRKLELRAKLMGGSTGIKKHSTLT